MSVLIENKANPNTQDREGMSALHWACSRGHLDAVKLLIEFHAFPNHMESTEDRYTPLGQSSPIARLSKSQQLPIPLYVQLCSPLLNLSYPPLSLSTSLLPLPSAPFHRSSPSSLPFSLPPSLTDPATNSIMTLSRYIFRLRPDGRVP